MSHIRTRIKLNNYIGIGVCRKESPSKMIAIIRRQARHDLKRAQAILSARNGDFRIYRCTGSMIERKVKVLARRKNLLSNEPIETLRLMLAATERAIGPDSQSARILRRALERKIGGGRR